MLHERWGAEAVSRIVWQLHVGSGVRIYVAGPYSADSEEDIEANVNAAIDAGIQLFRKGHSPYIPHLTHINDLRAKASHICYGWADYIRWDVPWIALCDAVLCLGESRGVKLELEEARRLGKLIFNSVNEIRAVDP